MAQATSRCLASRSNVCHETLLVASPRRNTEYSSRLIWALRAPTIKSVSEIVFVNAARAWALSCRTVSSKDTLIATEATIKTAVARRFQRLRVASLNRVVLMRRSTRCEPWG
jgi:hypothetical protein